MHRTVACSVVSRCLLTALLLVISAGAAGATELKVGVSSLSFITVAGTSPEPQSFIAYTTSPVTGFNPTVLASTSSGGNWLVVSTALGGSFPSSAAVNVDVNSATLAVGTYTGQITVTQSGVTGSPATVAVTLNVIGSAPFIVAEPASLSISARAGANPQPVALTVSNAGGGSLRPTFSATSSGASTNWLAVSQTTVGSFTNIATVSVRATSATLAAGTYSGTVTVTATGAANSPLNVPVTLRVGTTAGAVLAASPESFSFTAGLGANPPSRPLTLNNTGTGDIRPSIATSTADGGRWLVVTTSGGGSFPNALSAMVGVNIAGLAKGTYNGTVTVTDANATNSPLQIPVSLLVGDPRPVLRLNEYAWAFRSPVGAFRFTRTLEVRNLGTGLLKWRATINASGPAGWLTLQRTSGETVAELVNAVIDTTGLPAGVYSGEIVITADSVVSGENPQRVTVVLGVGVPISSINENGIVNGASFAQASVSGGEIVSIFGADFGPAQGVAASFVGGKLPAELAGVTVIMGGVAAPLFYVSDRQINALVPAEVAGREQVTVQVLYNSLPSAPAILRLRAANPGVFLVNSRPAILLNASNTLVSPTAPISGGDVIQIYATGLGALDTAIETGAPAPLDRLVRTRVTPRVAIGGVDAEVLFSGLAPGFVGLYQVNVRVPQGLRSGDNSLILSVDTAGTAPLTVPVR